jgi:hypothetical protein
VLCDRRWCNVQLGCVTSASRDRVKTTHVGQGGREFVAVGNRVCITRKLVSKREEISEQTAGPATAERIKSERETEERNCHLLLEGKC